MPLKTGKYAQVLWEKPGTGYLAFKVKFSTPGTYKIDSVSSDNSRAATIGLYIFPVNKDNTAKMVKDLGDAAETFDNLVENNAENIEAMIESFNLAAQSMKNLTDYLQMYPNSIITGKEY